jgi:DNA invertase Pin-like site-specific DNA recombinase
METQTSQIKASIERFIDSGMKNKSQIYTKVVEELGVPRTTVRRAARDLLKDLRNKVKAIDHAEEVFQIATSD